MTISTEMRFYRYRVESLSIIIPGEKEPIQIENGVINSFIIDKNYDKNTFPIFRLNVTLGTDLYYKILHHKLTVKFRMRIQKFISMSDDATKPHGTERAVKSDILNESFCIFLDENTPALYKKTEEAAKKTTAEDKSMQNIAGNDFNFFLFKETDLNNSKKYLNAVMGSTNMLNAVTFCMHNAGISKVLMSPFNNKATYSQVLLPPYTLLGTLTYLENHYGFYTNGSLLFFDFDVFYFIDKNPKCTAWRKGEYKKTIFHIKTSTNPDQFSPGAIDDNKEKTYFINIPTDAVTMTNASVLNDQIEGNHTFSLSPKSGTAKTIRSNSPQIGKGTYKFKVNKYENPYVDSAEAFRLSENGHIIQINMNDIDIEAITPNKEFSFIFEDSSIQKVYGGAYRISQSTSVFGKQGEDFSISTTAIFKKV